MTPTPTPMQPEQMPQGISWWLILVVAILVVAVVLLVLSMFRQIRRIQVPRSPDARGTQADAIRLAEAGELKPEVPTSPDEASGSGRTAGGDSPDGEGPDGRGLADPGSGR